MDEQKEMINKNETCETVENTETAEEKDSVFQWILRVIKGAIIGTGAILPGISGGVLSIVFGIYEKMMAFLSNIRKDFVKNVKFFLPIVIGLGLGVVLLAKLLGIALASSFWGPVTIWFFIGAIIGTLPMLFAEAGEQGRKPYHWVVLAVSTVISVGIMLFAVAAQASENKTGIEPNFFWWMFSGAVTCLGAILPGMSPSSILMVIGLYKPMSDSIGNLDIPMLIPYIIGGVAVLLLLSKPINWLFQKFHATMYHIILGVVIASTVLVPLSPAPEGVVYQYDVKTVIVCAVTFVIGAVMTVLLGKLEKKVR